MEKNIPLKGQLAKQPITLVDSQMKASPRTLMMTDGKRTMHSTNFTD